MDERPSKASCAEHVRSPSALHCRALSNLGPDLLQKIFVKLGPSPKHLVPLEAVCKGFRSVLESVTWKEPCIQADGQLCDALGYNDENIPPGGWRGLYKLLVYCPGLYPTLSVVVDSALETQDEDSWHYLGHVESSPHGFSEGKETKKVLQLRPEFLEDKIFVSSICEHGLVDDFQPPAVFGCRGVVKDFLKSRIARVSGAAAYVRNSQPGRKRSAPSLNGQSCPYCDGVLFEVNAFDNEYKDYEDMLQSYPPEEGNEPSSVAAYVCVNGHLLMGLFGSPQVQAGRLDGTAVLGGFQIEQGIVKLIAEELTEGKPRGSLSDGAAFVRTINLDDIIKVEARMKALLNQWPEPIPEGTRDRYDHAAPRPWLSKELSIFNGLHAILGFSTNKDIDNHVMYGDPSLETCLKAVGEDLRQREAVEKLAKEKAERLRMVNDALTHAGYRPDYPPDQAAVKSFVKDGGGSLDELMSRQKEAARLKELRDLARCAGPKDAQFRACGNPAPSNCLVKACRPCCKTYQHVCTNGKHRK